MRVRALLLATTVLLSIPAVAQTPAEAAAAKRAAAAAAVEKAAADKAEAEKAAAAQKAASEAAAAKAPAAPVYREGVIKVGDTLKQTVGKIADIDKGDNGCYITLKDDKGSEYIEIGKFEICTQKPPIKGKKVALAYNMETIQAASCYGDPKCKKTETVPLVVSVKIVE